MSSEFEIIYYDYVLEVADKIFFKNRDFYEINKTHRVYIMCNDDYDDSDPQFSFDKTYHEGFIDNVACFNWRFVVGLTSSMGTIILIMLLLIFIFVGINSCIGIFHFTNIIEIFFIYVNIL